jgi:MFS-type transporter involved in bile tolerance (Atg22 family)
MWPRKYLATQNVMALEHSPYSSDSSLPEFFLFPGLISALVGQPITSTTKVTAKATTALTEVLKNGFQESFNKLYEQRQKRDIAKGNYFERNVSYAY